MSHPPRRLPCTRLATRRHTTGAAARVSTTQEELEMDHTRASVLSVCTAAIIGAGASAGGLEEGAGAGGPTDWLDCGVQAMNDDLAQEIFGLTSDEKSLEYLIAEDQGNGIHLISSVRLMPAIKNHTIQSQTDSVGMYVEYQAPKFKEPNYRTQSIDIEEIVMGPSWEDLAEECELQLCLRPVCTTETLTLDHAASIGLYTGFDGSQTYIMGRLSKTQSSTNKGQGLVEGPTLLLPEFTADSIPVNTDIPLIDRWDHLRTLSESGAVRMTPNQVDEIYQSLATENQAFLGDIGLANSCGSQLDSCFKDANQDFDDAIFWCIASRSAKLERSRIVAGMCVGSALATAGLLKKVFAAAGLCVGGPKPAAVGGAAGFVVGFGYGAASGLVIGTCVAGLNENLCEKDAEELFEKDVARCLGDWLECEW